eukprot:8086022-Prorocentrum_lima.AAC.1
MAGLGVNRTGFPERARSQHRKPQLTHPISCDTAAPQALHANICKNTGWSADYATLQHRIGLTISWK